jgi:predicted DNA-binding protein
MGFIRRQEEQLVIRLLVWKYQRMNIRVPALSELQHQASKFVDEAHRIARKTGRNVASIIKEMIEDLKK